MIYKPITFQSKAERESYFRASFCTALGGYAVIDRMISDGFLDAPASASHHGNYAGGLFDHSVNVAEELWQLTNANSLKWLDPQSPLRIGILHDLCKIDQYIVDSNTSALPPEQRKFVYRKATLSGHGMKSVIYSQMYLPLTAEEIACIAYHMGAFTDKEEWSSYTNAVHQYPNVLWTHTADMIASQIMEV